MISAESHVLLSLTWHVLFWRLCPAMYICLLCCHSVPLWSRGSLSNVLFSGSEDSMSSRIRGNVLRVSWYLESMFREVLSHPFPCRVAWCFASARPCFVSRLCEAVVLRLCKRRCLVQIPGETLLHKIEKCNQVLWHSFNPLLFSLHAWSLFVFPLSRSWGVCAHIPHDVSAHLVQGPWPFFVATCLFDSANRKHVSSCLISAISSEHHKCHPADRYFHTAVVPSSRRCKNLQSDRKEEEPGCPKKSKWPPRGTGTTVLTYPGSAPMQQARLVKTVKVQVKWAAAHRGQDRRLPVVVTHSRLQRATSAPSTVGIVLEDGSGVAINWSPAGCTPPHGDSSMYSQANIRAGKSCGPLARALPSVIVDTEKVLREADGPVEMSALTLPSGGKVFAPGCTSKAGRVSRWGARRTLAVMQESRIDNYWNIDGSRDLSDSWTGCPLKAPRSGLIRVERCIS